MPLFNAANLVHATIHGRRVLRLRWLQAADRWEAAERAVASTSRSVGCVLRPRVATGAAIPAPVLKATWTDHYGGWILRESNWSNACSKGYLLTWTWPVKGSFRLTIRNSTEPIRQATAPVMAHWTRRSSMWKK